ncbi:MAG: TIGR03936 family radical SAM-associated protein [Treponema sp.]|jgi:radical SAM superfamily enzyme YgiQ (UPF0313 family)|nr:TIGR03936 family radical SAM-associated protein [Treponema sp.]
MARFVDPFCDLGAKLLSVEKPARYAGGEYGSIAKKDAAFRMVIAFPDLYEIGMSNQAFRIIYNALNRIPGISCDRAFAPAPDFEKLLEDEGVPLYGLDTGIALCDTDLFCFTFGYELGITGVLTMLHSSGVPIRFQDRGKTGPVVLMGGPCVSNPLPYSRFIDGFWIGEAEAGFYDLCRVLLEKKKSGAEREDLLSVIASHDNVWVPGKSGVRRAVYAGFGQTGPVKAAVFPVASIKTVQHHGAVEIMRGCPNGCRFCHAGIWYRPMRQKQADRVVREVEELVTEGGYREISLSSLSSGDYCYINELAAHLNAMYGSRHVSFQLPSLKVSGFSLPLLEKISEVRKSGLTFAVETPRDMWQLGINKTVKLEEILSILAEAKRRGWRGAKFYFMIGLPPAREGDSPEEEAIVEFVAEAGKRSRGHFHINVGTFVPKPHTPYESAAQLDENEGWRRLTYIMSSLKPLGHKVSVHDPFTAMLEGLMARGDERVGELIETAFAAGARLDPWSEHFRKDIWKGLFDTNRELVSSVLSEKKPDSRFPWSVIETGTSRSFLRNEEAKSRNRVLTSPCTENCTQPCGVCGQSRVVVKNNVPRETSGPKPPPRVSGSGPAEAPAVPVKTASPPGTVWRMLFSFSKTGPAVFVPHLGVIEVFSMALMRSRLRPVFTQGFNPHVKLDFASPAAVGIICLGEIACVDFDTYPEAERFLGAVNRGLPGGFTVTRAEPFAIPRGAKKHSPPSLLYGFMYGGDRVKAGDEKQYRKNSCPAGTLSCRTEVLARNPQWGLRPPQSPELTALEEYTGYFDAYRTLCEMRPGEGLRWISGYPQYFAAERRLIP